MLNASALALEASTTVSPALDAGDWKVLGTALPASTTAVDVVEFDRDDGITHDKTWVFTTVLVVDGVQVSLQERVTGTLTGSDMSQCMTAGTATTGFVDTNDPRSITFTGASGADYEVRWDLSGAGYKDIRYTLSISEPELKRITPVLPQIETIVMMMFENRSLDNVLGWLYRGSGPNFVYPPGSPSQFDGIPEGASNAYHNTSYSPAVGTQAMLQPCRVPNFDPGEAMPHVKNQLYADATGKLPSDDPWSATPSMTGFVWDYDAVYTQNVEVMGAYAQEQLPILYGLAQSYAVSDRWFSSAPTQTDPNRAFSICGTCLGAETNDDMNGSTFANTNTLFNVLGDAGKSWGIYWQTDGGPAAGSPLFDVYTPYFFSRISAAQNGGVYPYSTFLDAARQGTLPSFSFLEPKWGGGVGVAGDPLAWVGIQGNDYHPPAWIGPAEAELDALYDALVQSPQWPNMLLIITFDEHGGTWDHVPPPATVAPDGNVGKSGFKFDRLGVRVPTILVSPFIPSGLVFRSPDASADFDHTSFIATLLKWAGVDPASAGLGKRVAVAPTFEGVFRETRRNDTPSFTVPADYADQGVIADAPRSPVSLNAAAVEPPRRPMNVRDFRQACETSKSAEELHARLQALMYGDAPPRGTSPRPSSAK
ncbi:Acid phosphatase [Minicystis rosea]|nr:Acid phosphatase [Minicystis rosea]